MVILKHNRFFLPLITLFIDLLRLITLLLPLGCIQIPITLNQCFAVRVQEIGACEFFFGEDGRDVEHEGREEGYELLDLILRKLIGRALLHFNQYFAKVIL